MGEKRIGVFFDGTGNDRKADYKKLEEDLKNKKITSEEYNKELQDSNVSRMYDLYNASIYDKSKNPGGNEKIYVHGAGTRKLAGTNWVHQALGTEMMDKVEDALAAIKRVVYKNPNINILVDSFGFSRGATTARYFVNEVNNYIGKNNLHHRVKVGIVSIYDTVEADNRAWGKEGNINLNESSAEGIIHFTAKDEKRDAFNLTTATGKHAQKPSRVDETEMLGVHSDVGGGYSYDKVDQGSPDDIKAYKSKAGQRYTVERNENECFLFGNKFEKAKKYAKEQKYNTFIYKKDDYCLKMEHRVYEGLSNVHLQLMLDRANSHKQIFKKSGKGRRYSFNDNVLKKYYKIKSNRESVPNDLSQKIQTKFVHDSTLGLVNFDSDNKREIIDNDPSKAVNPKNPTWKVEQQHSKDHHTTIPSSNKYDYVNSPYNNFRQDIKYKLTPNLSNQNIKDTYYKNTNLQSNTININLENKSQKLFRKLGLRHEKIPTLNHNQNLPENIEGMYRKDDLSLKKNPRVSDKKAEAVAMHEIYHHTQRDKGLELGHEESQANMIEKAYLNENQEHTEELDFDLIYAYTIKQFYEHEELEQLVLVLGGDASSARRVYSNAIQTIMEFSEKKSINNIQYDDTKLKKVVGDSGVKFKKNRYSDSSETMTMQQFEDSERLSMEREEQLKSIIDEFDRINEESIIDRKGIAQGAKKIWKGVSQGIPESYSKAHPAARKTMDTALTIFEYGLTKPLTGIPSAIYDFTSGVLLPTAPTSKSGAIGHSLSNNNLEAPNSEIK